MLPVSNSSQSPTWKHEHLTKFNSHSWEKKKTSQKIKNQGNFPKFSHLSFISNSEILEMTQMYTNRWTIKQTVVQSQHGKLHSNKKGQTVDTCNNLDRFQGHYSKLKSQSEKVPCYMIPFIYHSYDDKGIEMENK